MRMKNLRRLLKNMSSYAILMQILWTLFFAGWRQSFFLSSQFRKQVEEKQSEEYISIERTERYHYLEFVVVHMCVFCTFCDTSLGEPCHKNRRKLQEGVVFILSFVQWPTTQGLYTYEANPLFWLPNKMFLKVIKNISLLWNDFCSIALQYTVLRIWCTVHICRYWMTSTRSPVCILMPFTYVIESEFVNDLTRKL